MKVNTIVVLFVLLIAGYSCASFGAADKGTDLKKSSVEAEVLFVSRGDRSYRQGNYIYTLKNDNLEFYEATIRFKNVSNEPIVVILFGAVLEPAFQSKKNNIDISGRIDYGPREFQSIWVILFGMNPDVLELKPGESGIRRIYWKVDKSITPKAIYLTENNKFKISIPDNVNKPGK